MNRMALKLPIFAGSLVLILSGCASQQKKNPTDPTAQIALGNRYSKGSLSISKNDGTAAEWYRKAALQGNAEGQFRLGICYDRGLGVPKNDILAAEWYAKGARGGNADAEYQLGTCYRLAKGVKPDLIKAYQWFNLAATSGNESAAESRDAVAHRMTADEIQRAQRMSRETWELCP